MPESPDKIIKKTAGKNLALLHSFFPAAFSLYKKASSEIALRLLKEKGLVSLESDLSIIHDLLRASDEKHAACCKRLVELRINLVLCLLGKVDHNVPAHNQIASAWIRIF